MTHFVFLLMSLKLFLMMSELVTSLFLSTKSSTGSIKTNTDPHFIGPATNHKKKSGQQNKNKQRLWWCKRVVMSSSYHKRGCAKWLKNCFVSRLFPSSRDQIKNSKQRPQRNARNARPQGKKNMSFGLTVTMTEVSIQAGAEDAGFAAGGNGPTGVRMSAKCVILGINLRQIGMRQIWPDFHAQHNRQQKPTTA